MECDYWTLQSFGSGLRLTGSKSGSNPKEKTESGSGSEPKGKKENNDPSGWRLLKRQNIQNNFPYYNLAISI